MQLVVTFLLLGNFSLSHKKLPKLILPILSSFVKKKTLSDRDKATIRKKSQRICVCLIFAVHFGRYHWEMFSAHTYYLNEIQFLLPYQLQFYSPTLRACITSYQRLRSLMDVHKLVICRSLRGHRFGGNRNEITTIPY